MKKLLAFLLTAVLCTSFAGCGEKPQSEENLDNPSQVDYGTVEKETVEVSVAKFNTQVTDNSETMNPAMEEYLTEYNGQYWYGLITGISLVAVPEEFTGNRKSDITKMMILRVDKGGEYEKDAPTYFKLLVKAGNDTLTDTEVDELINEANGLTGEKQSANNGSGINVSVVQFEDGYAYQVERIYK